MLHAGHSAPAARPALEVADILRERGDAYGETHRLPARQRKVVDALVTCRTAALGGFKAECDHCGAVTIQYASCRNRHCPKCQTLSQARWVERQCADLLDIGYWHVVFTLPHELNPVAQGNPALIYRLLFRAASRTLLEFGRNPRWLGGELGITMVLHTWGQTLGQHIHVHCIVTDGGLSPDGQRIGEPSPTAAARTPRPPPRRILPWRNLCRDRPAASRRRNRHPQSGYFPHSPASPPCRAAQLNDLIGHAPNDR